MKYGVARKLYVYNFDTEDGVEIITRPSDFLNGSNYCDEHDIKGPFLPEYVWGWHAIKRAGLIEKCGLPEELSPEAVEKMLDYVSMQFAEIEDDALPLSWVGQDLSRR